jgi:hypothetical protein
MESERKRIAAPLLRDAWGNPSVSSTALSAKVIFKIFLKLIKIL